MILRLEHVEHVRTERLRRQHDERPCRIRARTDAEARRRPLPGGRGPCRRRPPLGPRTWLRYDLVSRAVDAVGPESILDIGCGQGSIGVRLARRARYLGVEPDALATEMEHSPNVETFLRLDREFHLLSFSAADTSVLGDIVYRMWNTTQHYRRAFALLVDPQSNRALHYEHHLLVDSIQRGDIENAERVQLGHLRRTRLALERHPELFDVTL